MINVVLMSLNVTCLPRREALGWTRSYDHAIVEGFQPTNKPAGI